MASVPSTTEKRSRSLRGRSDAARLMPLVGVKAAGMMRPREVEVEEELVVVDAWQMSKRRARTASHASGHPESV